MGWDVPNWPYSASPMHVGPSPMLAYGHIIASAMMWHSPAVSRHEREHARAVRRAGNILLRECGHDRKHRSVQGRGNSRARRNLHGQLIAAVSAAFDSPRSKRRPDSPRILSPWIGHRCKIHGEDSSSMPGGHVRRGSRPATPGRAPSTYHRQLQRDLLPQCRQRWRPRA